MIKYIAKRILMMIPVLIGVTILVFTMLYFANGDPVELIAGSEATQEDMEYIRESLGLNDSYFVRLGRYFKEVLIDHDLGTSYRTGLSVSHDITTRAVTTMSLAVIGMAVAMLVGIPLGIFSATHQGKIGDSIAVSISLIGASCPDFLVAILLSLLFALHWRLLPASGWGKPINYVLPVLSFALSHAAVLARQTRSAMLEVIRQDYIISAKAKGVSKQKLIYHHALRNAMIPIVTQVGIMLGGSVGGAVVAETIFGIPGIGTYVKMAINSRDYPVVQGSVLFTAVSFSIIMLLVDIVYAMIDPRIRAQYASGRKKKSGEKNKGTAVKGGASS